MLLTLFIHFKPNLLIVKYYILSLLSQSFIKMHCFPLKEQYNEFSSRKCLKKWEKKKKMQKFGREMKKEHLLVITEKVERMKNTYQISLNNNF